jgi:hypothetical protein
VQWQVSVDAGTTWTDISGAKAPTMTLLDVPARDDGQRYRAEFSNIAGAKTSSAARLSVSSKAVVTAGPGTTTVPVGGSATFTVATAGSSPIQWQFSIDGGRTWIDIPGATSPTLTVNGASPQQNGDLFRAVVGSGSSATTTAGAVLIVAGANRKGSALCTPLRRHLRFRLARGLGRVISYTEYLDGHRIRHIRGHRLRLAILLGLSFGRHQVRIAATTSARDHVTVTRRFVSCAQISKRTHIRRPASRHH